MTFTIVVLICTLGQSASECIPQTARSHYEIGAASSDLDCMRQAQMNEGEGGVEIGADEYRKFMCVREDR